MTIDWYDYLPRKYANMYFSRTESNMYGVSLPEYIREVLIFKDDLEWIWGDGNEWQLLYTYNQLKLILDTYETVHKLLSEK